MCTTVVFWRFAMLKFMNFFVDALDAPVEGWASQKLDNGEYELEMFAREEELVIGIPFLPSASAFLCQ